MIFLRLIFLNLKDRFRYFASRYWRSFSQKKGSSSTGISAAITAEYLSPSGAAAAGISQKSSS